MTKEFSIDQAADEIYNLRTRAYFKEVLQSYTNGNYRSAIVMLWTVVVCDLVFKLVDLRDAYADSKAKSILEEIKSMQVDKPQSSEWELTLLKMAYERLHMFTHAEQTNLAHIQQMRHLSAHPIIDQESLYSPSKEQARSLMRNALEFLLLKPPLYSREIVDRFFEDIAIKFERGMFTATGKEDLFRYIKSAYLTGMSEYVYKKLFESAWKLCLKTRNEDTEKNKPITLLLLEILYDNRPDLCDSNIRERVDFYKEIDLDWSLNDLVNFLSIRYKIFPLLPEPLKFTIRESVKRDFHLLMKAFFLFESMEEHFNSMREAYLNGVTLNYQSFQLSCSTLLRISGERDCLDKCYELLCTLYTSSNSFDNANIAFNYGVKPNLDSFNEDLVKSIIEASLSNSQVTGRTAFHSSTKTVLERVKALGLGGYVRERIEKEYEGRDYEAARKRYEWWIQQLDAPETQEILLPPPIPATLS